MHLLFYTIPGTKQFINPYTDPLMLYYIISRHYLSLSKLIIYLFEIVFSAKLLLIVLRSKQ